MPRPPPSQKLLPLSLTMTELNGNEKFARLSASVPTQPSTPPAIHTGDLMMYGSSTLVLFYKSFSTTYSYTNIGRVDNPEGLDAALGAR
ncbi:MAG TPA: cyclophilin-like fold protein [Vicinamibacterales bacterium]|nr:cyclophilin-like fold protein [Vicinamibacterales bacterium]